MNKYLICGCLMALIQIQVAYANFPEYGTRECANCYDQQDDCYQQSGTGCTNNIIPCIQTECTKTKVIR